VKSECDILGDIADKRFRLLRSILAFSGLSSGLSFCQSITFVHRAQKTEYIDTISFAYDSSMSVPDYVKIWLTSVNSSLTKFCPKVTHPCWFQCRRHSMAMISQWSQYCEPTRNHHRSFEWYHRWPPYDLPSHKMGSQMHPAWPTSQRMMPLSEYDRRYRHNFRIRAMSSFVKLLWPLLVLFLMTVDITKIGN